MYVFYFLLFLSLSTSIKCQSLFRINTPTYFYKISIDTLGNEDTITPIVQRIIYFDNKNNVHWYEEPISVVERKIEDVLEIENTKELIVVKGVEQDTFYNYPEKFKIIQNGKNIYYRSNKNKANLIQYSLSLGDTVPAYTFNDFYISKKNLAISHPSDIKNIYLGDTIVEIFSNKINCLIIKSLYCCGGGELNNIREIRISYLEKGSFIPIYVEIRKELVPTWFSGFKPDVSSNIVGHEKIIPLISSIPQWMQIENIQKMLKVQQQKIYVENKELKRNLRKQSNKTNDVH